jgi:hypothetical protein
MGVEPLAELMTSVFSLDLRKEVRLPQALTMSYLKRESSIYSTNVPHITDMVAV